METLAAPDAVAEGDGVAEGVVAGPAAEAGLTRWVATASSAGEHPCHWGSFMLSWVSLVLGESLRN